MISKNIFQRYELVKFGDTFCLVAQREHLTGSTARLYLSNEKEARGISVVCGLNGFWICIGWSPCLVAADIVQTLAGEPGDGGHRGTQCACLDRHRPSTEDDLITGSAYYQAVCGHSGMTTGRTKHRPLKARGVRT